MILLLSSLAFAQTTITIGESQEYDSIYDALEALRESNGGPESVEIILESDYNPFDELVNRDTYTTGLAFDHDVIIRSSVAGELREVPYLYFFGGAQVELYDLQIVDNGASTYQLPGETGSGSFELAPLTLREESTLYADNLHIRGLDGNSFGSTHVYISASSATFERCHFVDNTPSAPKANPFEYLNYVIGVRNGSDSQDHIVKLLDTELINKDIGAGSGGGIFLRSEGSTRTRLEIKGGEIGNTQTESAGSAVWTRWDVDTQVDDLHIYNAGNTAVKLEDGMHTWLSMQVELVSGSQGGVFNVANAGNLTTGGFFSDANADFGGLVYLNPGSSLVLAAANMSGGGAEYAGAVYGANVFLEVRNSRFCNIRSDDTPLLYTSSGLDIRNTVFRTLYGGQGALQAGGTSSLVNNTFVDMDGPALTGPASALLFHNNAVVRTERAFRDLGSQLDLDYNLYYENSIDLPGAGLSVGQGTLVNTAPGFWDDFLDNPGDCTVDPYPAAGSPLLGSGDPGILNGDGSRSDIGAFGGPDADSYPLGPGSGSVDPNPEGSGTILLGGCSGTGSLALVLLPLLGLGRRRR